MIRIDTHFHPNFLRSLPNKIGRERQAKKIWKSIQKHKLDALIVTEHVFKYPALSYKTLLEHTPKGAKTYLIPWVEALTKEWIDVLVFCKDTYIYTCEEIMTAEKLTFDEMIEYINNDERLYWVVTHPFILSTTWLIHHFPEEKILEASKKLGIIEKHNPAFVTMKQVLQKSIFKNFKIIKHLIQKFEKVENVPEKHYTKETIIFWWSDAHNPNDLWDYTILKSKSDDIRESILDSSLEREYIIDKERSNVRWYMLRNGCIILWERIIKSFKLSSKDATYTKNS